MKYKTIKLKSADNYIFKMLFANYIVICLVINQIVCMTLEGSWILDFIFDQNSQNPTSTSIKANISEQVYRNTQIMNRIVFKTCNNLSYQIQIIEDNFYVNIETKYFEENNQCNENQTLITKQIDKNIGRVFKFIINDDTLILQDPYDQNKFIFHRQYRIGSINITGAWLVSLAGYSSIIYPMIATNSSLSICGTVFNYFLNGLYQITLSLTLQNDCQDKGLISSFSKIKYLRLKGSTLQFYDAQINLISEGSVNKIATITIEKPSSTNIPLSTSSTNSLGFKSGNYLLLLLLRRDLGRLVVKVTDLQISLKICGNIKLSYKLAKSTGGIMMGSSSNPCSNNDAIYYNYLIGAVEYSIDSEEAITLIDKDKKQIIVLTPQ